MSPIEELGTRWTGGQGGQGGYSGQLGEVISWLAFRGGPRVVEMRRKGWLRVQLAAGHH